MTNTTIGIGLFVLVGIGGLCLLLLAFQGAASDKKSIYLNSLQNQMDTIQNTQIHLVRDVKVIEEIIWQQSADLKQQMLLLKSAVLNNPKREYRPQNPEDN